MFTIPKRDLVRALESVASVASKKSIQPILKCARFTVAKSRLTMQATDLFTSVTTCVDVERAKAADVAIDASAMLARLKSLEDGDVTVESTGKSVAVKGSKSRRFTLPMMSGEDFPTLASPDDASTVAEIPASALAHLLAGTRYASSRDEQRAHIACVLLRFQDGKITAAATDGHRIALRDAKVDGARASADLLVPNAGVAELLRLAEGDHDDVVRIATHEQMLVATLGRTSVSLKVVDGAFPPIEHILNRIHPDRSVTCSRQRLLDGIKAVSVASDQTSGRVVLEIESDRVRLLASSQDGGEFVDEFSGSLDGKPLRIAFAWRIVADALAAIGDEEISIRFGGELDPAVLKTSDTTAIMMPQRF